jgi:hypothetical protein
VVIGDTVVEGNESFFVNLTSATNATIADGQGIGTIVDDDGGGGSGAGGGPSMSGLAISPHGAVCLRATMS